MDSIVVMGGVGCVSRFLVWLGNDAAIRLIVGMRTQVNAKVCGKM
jgi:hypothetical protein